MAVEMLCAQSSQISQSPINLCHHTYSVSYILVHWVPCSIMLKVLSVIVA